MITLYEGCYGITRGGEGVPQEVVGPVVKTGPSLTFEGWKFKTEDGVRYFRTNGVCEDSDGKRLAPMDAVFPDRASAEAALAGGAPPRPAQGRRDLLAAIKWAHDTLYELNPSNYDHDEVCKVNDAAVEVILGLAPLIGETHGKSPEWWAARINRFEPDPVEVGVGIAPRPAAEAAPVDWEARRWDAYIAARGGNIPRSAALEWARAEVAAFAALIAAAQEGRE